MRKAHAGLATLAVVAALAALPAAFAASDSASSPKPAPRYADGKVRLDRAPGEKGYWDSPSVTSLVESGAKVEFDKNGKLKNIADAPRVAPFQPWALALYKHRQSNNFADDPMQVCIGPGNPRQMMTPGGLRIIEDRNYKRVYMLFGGGNHGWRLAFLDGREAPNPDEVTATFYGLSVGKWEGDTLVVDTTNFTDKTRFRGSTADLHVVERFTRLDDKTLKYRFTIEDKNTWAQPWTGEYTWPATEDTLITCPLPCCWNRGSTAAMP